MKTFIFAALAALFFASCGSQKSASHAYSNSGWKSDISDQYIIYTSTINLTVNQPDSANVQLAKIASKYRGYLNESGTSQTILRVDSQSLDSALVDIEALGEVAYKNVQGRDVGEEYADYAIRLDNAEKARSRYLELLARAETVEAALLVEKELERLNGTIELMKGKMTRIDHLVDYSTITVSLKEKKKPGVIGYVAVGCYKGIKWLFVRN